MLISRKRYELICEIIVDQSKKISHLEESNNKLREENFKLYEENEFLKYANDQAQSYFNNLDFPNSTEGGLEGSNIFFM